MKSIPFEKIRVCDPLLRKPTIESVLTEIDSPISLILNKAVLRVDYRNQYGARPYNKVCKNHKISITFGDLVANTSNKISSVQSKSSQKYLSKHI